MTSMNPIVITIIIATATFILSIFSALQFFASRMERYIDAKVEGLRGEIATVRAEIQTVNNRVSDVQARLERVERQIDTLFASFKPIPPGRGD